MAFMCTPALTSAVHTFSDPTARPLIGFSHKSKNADTNIEARDAPKTNVECEEIN